MRMITSILAIIDVVVLAIFAVENIRPQTYNFVGFAFPGNLWWTVAGSALLGFILATLLMAPGRIAAGWRGRRLNREQGQSTRQLTDLQTRNAQLEQERQQIAAERDQMRSQLAAPRVAPRTTATTTETTAAKDVLIQPNGEGRPDTIVQRDTTVEQEQQRPTAGVS